MALEDLCKGVWREEEEEQGAESAISVNHVPDTEVTSCFAICVVKTLSCTMPWWATVVWSIAVHGADCFC